MSSAIFQRPFRTTSSSTTGFLGKDLSELEIFARVLLAARAGKRSIIAAGKDWTRTTSKRAAVAWQACDMVESRVCPGSGGPPPLGPDGLTPAPHPFAPSRPMSSAAEHAALAAQHATDALASAIDASHSSNADRECNGSVICAIREAMAAGGTQEFLRIQEDFETLRRAQAQGRIERHGVVPMDILPPIV